MLSRQIGNVFLGARDAVARGLIRAGVTPNALTLAGLVVTVGAGWLIALGRPKTAVLVMVGAGACDMLDGAVAKLGRKATPFGGFLDSCIDRYSDIALFAGVYFYFHAAGKLRMEILTLVALAGALLTSYTRARAECLIDQCKVGFWERGERVVALMIALVMGHLTTAVWLLAPMTHLTVIQRMVYAARRLSKRPTRGLPTPMRILQWDFPRGSRAHDVAVWLVIAVLVFVNLPA